MDAGAHRRSQSASDTCEPKEREGLLHEAVSRLPVNYRCVVELCDLQCLPAREAARLLGVTVPAVKTRRHRARLKLRRLVGKVKPRSREGSVPDLRAAVLNAPD